MELPLECPMCFMCRKDAMLCKCTCVNAQELVTLTSEPEPTSMEEGIRRWVNHTEKHPQARRFDGTAFGDKILEMGFIPALLKEQKSLAKMAHEYSAWAFSSLSAAQDASWTFVAQSTAAAEQEMLHHRQHLGAEALLLFVQCHWSRMTWAHAEFMFNAIQSYKPETRLRFSLQQMWDAIAMIRNMYQGLSKNQSYSFEALQHLAKQPSAPPSTAAKAGLSLPQFQQLMTHLIKERNDALRWVVSVNLQINAVLEEVLGWRASYFLLHDEVQPVTLEVLRPPTRLCTMLEQKVKKLANSTICPVVALSILDAKAMHAAGKRTDPQRFAHLLRSNQLAMAYVVHDKRSRSMPRLASAVKREIAEAVNAVGVSLQSYEVQPLLDACRRNYRAQKWDPLDEHSRCDYCNLDGKLVCSVCKQRVYCSKMCQKKDWKTHKLTCKPQEK